MEGVIRLVREKVLWLQVRVGLSGSRKLLEEARGRDAGGCSYGSLGPCSHTVNMFQGPSPGLTPSPQGRTHPSFPSCSLEICHFQGRRWQPADFLGPPWFMPLGSLPEWGGGMFLHAMSGTGLPPRGVVAGPRAVLLCLQGTRAHDR